VIGGWTKLIDSKTPNGNRREYSPKHFNKCRGAHENLQISVNLTLIMGSATQNPEKTPQELIKSMGTST
jgi:hypothetical protein